MSSGVNVKVFLNINDNVEIKRFYLDQEVISTFILLNEKLLTIFPILRDNEFKIFWKDSDNDDIIISTDEDLDTFLIETSDMSPVTLYIKSGSNSSKKPNMDESPRSFRVVCDVCHKGITGYRYKCIECPDYDLCTTCEANGHHSEHLVLRLPNSDTSIAKLDRRMIFNAAKALKRSACTAARDAHRFARHATEKDKNCKSRSAACGPSTSSSNNSERSQECPFSQSINLNPLMDIFNRVMNGQSEKPNEEYQFQDVIRSAVDQFFGTLKPEPEKQTSATDNSASTSKNNSETLSNNNSKPSEENPPSYSMNNNVVQTETIPPPIVIDLEKSNGSEKDNNEMDWTILNDNTNETLISPSAPPNPEFISNVPQTTPQNLRLMRGLAQLHEMGFSNEGHFLNYLLEQNDYDVSKVVKAMVDLQ